MNLERRLAQLARRAGFAVSRHPTYLSLEYHLRDLLRLQLVELVLDVGAHHGEFGQMLRRDCAYTGRIVSFEPASAAMSALATVRDDRWDAHQVALGDADGAARLHLFGSTDLNSFLSPSKYGAEIFDMSARGDEEVPVRRLDELLAELKLDPSQQRTMLKVDTQGRDLAVLAGGSRTVAQVMVLQTEVSLQDVYDDSPGLIQTLQTLLDLGFEVTGLFPIGRDNHLRVTEMDCVMVRAEG
jgi:FkbM family methyltransferase